MGPSQLALAPRQATRQMPPDEHEEEQRHPERREPEQAIGRDRVGWRHGHVGHVGEDRDGEQQHTAGTRQRPERDVDEECRRQHLEDVEKEQRARRAPGRDHDVRDDEGVPEARPREHGRDPLPACDATGGDEVHCGAGAGGDERGDQRPQDADRPRGDGERQEERDHGAAYANRPAQALGREPPPDPPLRMDERTPECGHAPKLPADSVVSQRCATATCNPSPPLQRVAARHSFPTRDAVRTTRRCAPHPMLGPLLPHERVLRHGIPPRRAVARPHGVRHA